MTLSLRRIAAIALLLGNLLCCVNAAEETFNLEGTSWQLVQIQSMDDKVLVPNNPRNFTVRFRTENRLVVEADCNRAGATWLQDGSSLVFEGLVTTRAMCPPPSMFNRFIADLTYISSFVTRDGHLFLATMADGAILEFEPLVFSPQ